MLANPKHDSTDKSRHPFRVFLGILFVTILIVLFPPELAGTGGLEAGTRDENPPVLFGYPVTLPRAQAACPNSCEIQVCTRWVPEGHPRCPVGGSGGGCCLSTGTDCDPGCQEEETPLPPTISGSLTCSRAGTNGWCAGTLSLNLTASDPQGQTLLISGDMGGIPFACPNGATSCSVPAPEGSGTANFAVTSMTGLTAGGALAYQRDSLPPQINGSQNGSPGANGWFTSQVEVEAQAGDSVSGVAAFDYSLDGGAWTEYQPLLLSDGVYEIAYRAVDAAGNQTEVQQSLQVDATSPVLDVSVTGAAGADGWYRTSVQVLAEAQDPGSGLDALEYNLARQGWRPYEGALVLPDGIHPISLRAVDQAGNQTGFEQEIRVDTLTPQITVALTGETGAGGWFVSGIQVEAAAADGGSGLAAFEYSLDEGTWSPYNAPLSFADGQRSLRFRATDRAGNTTITPPQTYKVDTAAPLIELPDAWELGHRAEYAVTDGQSGVHSVRIVIEDDLEQFKKVHWYGEPVDVIGWDGRFADGVQAPDGEYLVTIKAVDRAGNESARAGLVTVENNLFTLLLPPFIPPAQTPPPLDVGPAAGPGEIPAGSFGGGASEDLIPVETGLFSEGGQTTVTGQAGSVAFSSPAEEDSQVPSPADANILWGATATAAAGAFSAEILRRKREEEQAAQAGAQGSGSPSGYARKIRAKKKAESDAAGVAQALARQARLDAVGQSRLMKKEILIEIESRAYTAAPQETTLPAGLGGGANKNKAKKTPDVPIWEQAVQWIDENQIAASLIVGAAIGAGVAAILLTGGAATPLVAAAWIAGGTALAGGTVALGTVGLNAYFDRPLTTNLAQNVSYAALAAAVIPTASYLLIGPGGAATYSYVQTGLAQTCATHLTLCTGTIFAGQMLDTAEQFILAGQMVYHEWTGNDEAAAETALELHTEMTDGGLPGNLAVNELIDQFGYLVDELGPMMLNYGEDVYNLVRRYGADGVALLERYGDEGLTMVDRMSAVLDAETFTEMMHAGPDAFQSLSYWSDDLLIQYGDDLAERAARDAIAMQAASQLSLLDDPDSPEAQALLQTIAENSIQGEGDRIVLGHWVPNSLDEGFIGTAREQQALYYGPNPGLEAAFAGLDPEAREELFWAVNQQALQQAVDFDWEIDYSLDGLDPASAEREIAAIQALSEGSMEIAAGHFDGELPFRMREIDFLLDQGYIYQVDPESNLVEFVRPE